MFDSSSKGIFYCFFNTHTFRLGVLSTHCVQYLNSDWACFIFLNSLRGNSNGIFCHFSVLRFLLGRCYTLITCSTDISYIAHRGGGWGEWREKVFVTRLFDTKSTEREGRTGKVWVWRRAKSAAKSSCFVDWPMASACWSARLVYTLWPSGCIRDTWRFVLWLFRI